MQLHPESRAQQAKPTTNIAVLILGVEVHAMFIHKLGLLQWKLCRDFLCLGFDDHSVGSVSIDLVVSTLFCLCFIQQTLVLVKVDAKVSKTVGRLN